MIDITEILKILPHRYPLLLVDRVLEMEKNVSIKCIKNVTFNEPFFQGHFPGHPVMPGVLILEALAQAAGILSFKSADVEGKLVYFMGIDKAKFRRPVVPGDTMELNLTVIKQRGPIWGFKGVASVDGNRVANAELMATIVDREDQ